MTAFREDTSFPFLKIARECGVDYSEVLLFAEVCELNPGTIVPAREWQKATQLAVYAEEGRRAGL